MATEILINDGGAPARILPFTAGSSISAGDFCEMASDGEVDTVAATHSHGVGVALTAQTSGNIVSIISGKGVILRTLVSGTAGDFAGAVAAGDALCTSVNGYLLKGHTTFASGTTIAVALEAQTAGSGLKKVLMF